MSKLKVNADEAVLLFQRYVELTDAMSRATEKGFRYDWTHPFWSTIAALGRHLLDVRNELRALGIEVE
jgi:hypothetical protein